MHKRKRTTSLILLALSLTTGCNKIPQLQQVKGTSSSASNYSPRIKIKVPISASSYIALKDVPCSNTVLALGRNRVSTSYDNIVASLREASIDNSITKLKEVLAFLEVLYENRTTPALDDLSVRDLNEFADLLIGLVTCILATKKCTKKAAQVVVLAIMKARSLPRSIFGEMPSPEFFRFSRDRSLLTGKSKTHRIPMLLGAYTMKLIQKTVLRVQYATEEKYWSFKAIKYPIEVTYAANIADMQRILKTKKKSTANSNLLTACDVELKDPRNKKYFSDLKGIICNRAPFYIGKHRKVFGKEKICCIGLSKKL